MGSLEMGDNDDSTVFITDIRSALDSTEEEVGDRPGALLVVGGQYGGTLFDLVDEDISVGRNADNTISLEANGVSRYHLRVGPRGDRWVVQDAGSKNGTFLNNKKIESPTFLSKGDIIKIGSIALKYIPKGDSERVAYDKLRWEASRDQHTGCLNKTYFKNAVNLHLKRSKIGGIPLSLVLFDIDNFKEFNDKHGHDAGDYILREMASLVHKEAIRSDDIFARYGGEEFVVLLPKTSLEQAVAVAERLRTLIAEYDFNYDEKKFAVTVSVGVATGGEDVETGIEFFKRADKAVYKAKEEGRNNVQCYRTP